MIQTTLTLVVNVLMVVQAAKKEVVLILFVQSVKLATY